MFDVKPVTTGRATACGPACLKMLLAYYGIEAELDQLITECGVGLTGCTAADVRRVGRAHGLEDLAAYGMAPEEVATQDRPAIVWWRRNHFIVCCGLNDRGDVVICNPSRGRFSIDLDSFCVLCTGLEPGSCVALCNGQPEDLPGPETPDIGELIDKVDAQGGQIDMLTECVLEMSEVVYGG